MTDKKTVLIVEDEEDMQFMYGDMLKEKYDVTIVGTTKAARKKLADSKYDLMILDLVLPGEHGEVLLEELEKGNKYKNMKIAVATKIEDLAYSLRDKYPDVEFLRKPFTLPDLERVMEGKG